MNRLLAYASTFVTFLIRELGDQIKKVDVIILYGSVAKGEATVESDIDLFIDTKDEKVKKRAEEIADKFLDSREAALFKTEGIGNEISIKVGELQQWKSLHHSIMNSGIILWQYYRQYKKPSEGKHSYLFFWNKIGKNRGAFLNALYGYSIQKKKYLGLLQRQKGIKAGKSSILIPARHKEEFIALFKKYAVQAQQKEVWVYE